MISDDLQSRARYVLVVALICGGVLLVAHLLTSTFLESHTRKARLQIFVHLLPSANYFTSYTKPIILGLDASKKKVGYILASSGHGYGGPVTLLVGLSGSKVTGIEILSHTETTGMGNLIMHKSPMSGRAFGFQGQFNQKSIFDQFSTHEDIIALSGATISSQAVGDAIKGAIKIYRRLENIQYEN